MTREAELKARDFVALVAGGVHAETEVGVAQRLLLQAQTALDSYADPEWARAEGWPAFADRLLELARGAEAGSDHQLAYVNALCGSVLSQRHVAVLPALLDTRSGRAGPGGARGRHRPALAHRHRAGRGGRCRRRRRRDTVHRRRGASGIRPPRASGTPRRRRRRDRRPAVKEAAWQQVIEDDTLANITARSIIGGFVRPGQDELLAAVPGQVLRCDFRCVGAAVERGRADGRHRAVPVVGRQPGRPGRGGRGSSPMPRCRRRCAGWWSRAARVSSAHCGPAPSTSPSFRVGPHASRGRAPPCTRGRAPSLHTTRRGPADSLCTLASDSRPYALRMPVSRSRRARAARRRKRRMGLVVNDLTGEEWAALKSAWNGCAYCGAADGPLQRDCVLAISRGGRYTVDNVVPACALVQYEQVQRRGDGLAAPEATRRACVPHAVHRDPRSARGSSRPVRRQRRCAISKYDPQRIE